MATALADFGLNERQEHFVRRLSAGADFVRAATDAGYSETDGYRLLKNPLVVAAVEHELRRVLVSEAAPLALSVLQSIVREEKHGAPSRVAAAKILLDRAGIVPPASKEAGAERSLADMSSVELKEFIGKHEGEIGKIEGELAARATPVNAPHNAPTPDDTPDKATDFLD